MSTSTAFRPLNEHEIKALRSYNSRGKIPDTHPLIVPNSAEISYEKMQGGFCVCVIMIPTYVKNGDLLENGYRVLRGASRQSYKDPRKPIRGEMLAFSRAILYSRPMEVMILS